MLNLYIFDIKNICIARVISNRYRVIYINNINQNIQKKTALSRGFTESVKWIIQ